MEDLVHLCAELNAQGAKFIVVGGCAIRGAGYMRETMNVNLLSDTCLENEALVYLALEILTDQADLLFLRQQYSDEIFGAER